MSSPKYKKPPYAHEGNWAEKFIKKNVPSALFPHVFLSLVIPVYNCSEKIAETLESIKRQNYLSLEVIIVDAGSTDRTLEIVNAYYPMIARVYTVEDFDLYEMINRGISLASGSYISISFPGTLYLSSYTFQIFAQKIQENENPESVYCGSIQREGKRLPRILNASFEVDSLRQGIAPSSLPAFWFRSDLFDRFGKFTSTFTVRAPLDFFCRLATACKFIHIDRVYVDFDFGSFSYHKLLLYMTDTLRILRLHFGLRTAFIWFLGINHLNMLKWWYRNLKKSFFKI